ncbi:response regulator [Galactobacter caseinivorans]|uniref:Transcriptional regulatory protein n=1 Tax=Galactobacter caseinivorans TaxID=2676123 RepID=A0A496PJT7_9MICC|nr:response regulator [Galactobacter caseinivorans]RKW70762.1 response regulator [Galactobacter caseinivorans]
MHQVLIVDDEPVVARIHAGFVAKEPGFAVCGVAADAASALELVRSLHPDLVLLDIHLPDGNGLDLLHRMRQLHPSVEAVVITAAREQHTVSRALREGVVGYLMKPFQRADLQARLTAYLDRARLSTASGAVEQEQVDRLFGASGPQPAAPTPRKGLSEQTLRAVEQALGQADDGISASAASEHIGISRVSARRYLEHLVASGVATVQLRYGAGRPERLYVLRR